MFYTFTNNRVLFLTVVPPHDDGVERGDLGPEPAGEGLLPEGLVDQAVGAQHHRRVGAHVEAEQVAVASLVVLSNIQRKLYFCGGTGLLILPLPTRVVQYV